MLLYFLKRLVGGGLALIIEYWMGVDGVKWVSVFLVFLYAFVGRQPHVSFRECKDRPRQKDSGYG